MPHEAKKKHFYSVNQGNKVQDILTSLHISIRDTSMQQFTAQQKLVVPIFQSAQSHKTCYQIQAGISAPPQHLLY